MMRERLPDRVATMLSIALQHGATVEELLAATGRSEVNEMGRAVERPHTLIGTVLAGLALQQSEDQKCLTH